MSKDIIDNLLRDLSKIDASYYDRLKKFAKAKLRKDHILLNIREMESQVDPEKVRGGADLERIEIDIWGYAANYFDKMLGETFNAKV